MIYTMAHMVSPRISHILPRLPHIKAPQGSIDSIPAVGALKESFHMNPKLPDAYTPNLDRPQSLLA